MATDYKILGQAVDHLKIDAPENGSTIISELKIKNTSIQSKVSVMCASSEEMWTIPIDALREQPEYPFTLEQASIVRFSTLSLGEDYILLPTHSAIRKSDSAYDAYREYIKVNVSNGSIDTSFVLDDLINNLDGSRIHELAVVSNNKIIINTTGYLRETVGDDIKYFPINRLNPDGSIDSSFNSPEIISSNDPYMDTRIKVLRDGKILLTGNFIYINGVEYPKSTSGYQVVILESDGSVFKFLGNAEGNYYFPFAIDEQPDGKILLGNYGIDKYNNTPVMKIFRINTDGSLDNSFVPPQANYNVPYLASQSDGKIIVATQSFSEGDKIIRLNQDGSLDTSFSSKNFGGGFTVLPNDHILITNSGNVGIYDRDGNIISDLNAAFTEYGIHDGFLDGVGLILYSDFDSMLKFSKISFASKDENYLIKDKVISYDEEIKISGGIALESSQSLAASMSSGQGNIIIQTYGIEETG